MRHVFVETNWVVGYAAPAHHQLPAAQALLDRVKVGEVRLYLPGVCLTEAREAILRRFQPRGEANAIREFLAWSRTTGKVSMEDDAAVRRVIDMFESRVRQELRELNEALSALRGHSGIEIYGLSDEMLERAVMFGAMPFDLKPFDQAILAAILVRAEQLAASGNEGACFCELDTDLQPWDRYGNRKLPLADLYDGAKLWVYGDFELNAPQRPSG